MDRHKELPLTQVFPKTVSAVYGITEVSLKPGHIVFSIWETITSKYCVGDGSSLMLQESLR